MTDKKQYDYDPHAGEHIAAACKKLVEIAAGLGRTTTASFNDTELRAELGMSAGDVEAAFHRERDRLQAEYDAKRRAFEQTPEGKEKLRKAEERRRYVKAEVAKGMLQFSIRDQAAWDKTLKANADDGYGSCALRFAARWANYMERDLAKGAPLANIVNDTSHEADIEGITGFMYGCARSILEKVWAHGEALKRVAR